MEESSHRMSLLVAWLPYLIIAALLVLSRLPELNIGTMLKSLAIPSDPSLTENLFGSTVTIKPVQPLYLPGTIFIVACLVTIVLHRMSGAAVGRAVKRSPR